MERNTVLIYGADGVLRIFLFYLIFMPTGRKPGSAPAWPLRLMQIQIAFIYVLSGIAKADGSMWRDGTAVAVSLLSPNAALTDFSRLEALPGARAFLAGLTYLTWVWECAFPLLISWQPIRWATLAVGVAMHVGTLLTLNVPGFALVMIFSYVALLPNDVWARRIS
jgi:hypothetical protein